MVYGLHLIISTFFLPHLLRLPVYTNYRAAPLKQYIIVPYAVALGNLFFVANNPKTKGLLQGYAGFVVRKNAALQ